jgi:hypothetical protein
MGNKSLVLGDDFDKFSKQCEYSCSLIVANEGYVVAGTVISGAFAKFRKATVSFIISACPSVRPYDTTQFPLDGIS